MKKYQFKELQRESDLLRGFYVTIGPEVIPGGKYQIYFIESDGKNRLLKADAEKLFSKYQRDVNGLYISGSTAADYVIKAIQTAATKGTCGTKSDLIVINAGGLEYKFNYEMVSAVIRAGYDTDIYYEYAIRIKSTGFFVSTNNNSKLGSIPTFNIPARVTCDPKYCAFCLKECYVNKMFQHGYDISQNGMLPHYENLNLIRSDLDAWYVAMDSYLTLQEKSLTGARYFRIHSAGDFFSKAYFKAWTQLVKKHSAIQFLAFTKQFSKIDTSAADIPNFHLYLSAWSGAYEIPADLLAVYPVADCFDSLENVPAGYELCGGACESCGLCFFNKSNKAFIKH